MKRTKLLVFTDDCKLIEFIKRHLDPCLYDVVFRVPSGQGMDRILYEEQPEFTIIDIILPALDGIALSLDVRQISDVPILMLSSCGAGIDRVRKLDLSSETYLSEPLTGEDLKSIISSVHLREAITNTFSLS